MTRRTRAELEAEYNRLYDVYEYFQRYTAANPRDAWESRCLESFTDRDEWLRRSMEKGVTLSQIVGGLREAANDTGMMLLAGMQDGDGGWGKGFLAYYGKQTGRDFWRDVGNPIRVAKKIVKRGHILDETEFRLLTDVTSDVEQTALKPAEIERANEMLRAFEESARG